MGGVSEGVWRREWEDGRVGGDVDGCACRFAGWGWVVEQEAKAKS